MDFDGNQTPSDDADLLQVAHDLAMPLAGLMAIQEDMVKLDKQAQEIFAAVVERLRSLAVKYKADPL